VAVINQDPNQPTLDAIDAMFNGLRLVSPFNDIGNIMADEVPQEMDPGNGQIQPVGFLGEGSIDDPSLFEPGVVPPTSFDTTPPDEPTGLTLDSELAQQADGSLLLRLVASLTQPADADLYASFVEVTANESAPGTADWDHPIVLQIGASHTSAAIEGVAGGTLYYARAYSVDVQGNRSTTTAEVTYTTLADAEAPEVPQSVQVIAGFRGLGLSWQAGSATDLAFYQVRYAPDDGTGTGPGADPAWTRLRTKTSVIFIPDLTPDTLYWVQVRSVDLSGNTATSTTDATAVNFDTNPDLGWTDQLSGTPTLVGLADIAAASITAANVVAGSLSADDLGAGTLRIRPLDGFASGILVLDASGNTLGVWDEDGIKIINPADPSQYVLLDAGELKFTIDNGASFESAITPEGINASAINFGSSPGGHNLILNSSFELADFIAAPATLTFTDTATWETGHRVTALDNITEGTALTMTTPGY
jgi:hypothetical protein